MNELPTNTPPAKTTASGNALVLSGGGARGSYQAGVLRGLVDHGLVPVTRSGFDILIGNSAGSINAAMMAAHADAFGEGVRALEGVWGSLTPDRVFRTDLKTMGGIGARWVRDLSFGGVTGKTAPKSLLDTAPLAELLASAIPFERIPGNVASGAVEALAVAATDLDSSEGVLFMTAAPDAPVWRRAHRFVERATIGAEHLMASSAIPVFFPSVSIGSRHFGDGCIRNTAPLSPAIQLGARRILAVGVRERGARRPRRDTGARTPPSIAQIAGVLLDAVMLDAVEVDVEHSQRVNESVIRCAAPGEDGAFRHVDVLMLSPSRDVRQIAAEMSDRVPRIVRYLMRGLGTDEAADELTSYLLFDGAFCRKLMEVGYDDVAARRDEIAAFFEA